MFQSVTSSRCTYIRTNSKNITLKSKNKYSNLTSACIIIKKEIRFQSKKVKKVKGKNGSKFGQIKLNSKQVHAIQSELSEPSDSIALWQNILGCLTLICPNPWCTC